MGMVEMSAFDRACPVTVPQMVLFVVMNHELIIISSGSQIRDAVLYNVRYLNSGEKNTPPFISSSQGHAY
jgi:hypothetical protein